jgi:hypothetical protein
MEQAGSSRPKFTSDISQSTMHQSPSESGCCKEHASAHGMSFDSPIMELNYKDYASKLLLKYDVAVCIMHSCFMMCMLKVHITSFGMSIFPFGMRSAIYMLLRSATVLSQIYLIWRTPLRYIRLRTTFVGTTRVLRFLLATWHGDIISKSSAEKSLLHSKFTSGGALVLLMILPLSTILPVPNHVILQLALVLFALPRAAVVGPGSRISTVLVKRLCVAWGRLTYWPCRALGLALPPTSVALVPDEDASRVTAILTVVLLGFLLPTIMTFVVEVKMRTMFASSSKRRLQQPSVRERLAALPEVCIRQLKWIAMLLVPALIIAGTAVTPRLPASGPA